MSRPKRTITMPGQDMPSQIKAVARRQMAEHGTAGIALRSIARELGITAPAIYNYFPRLDDLITALIVDAFTDLAATMEAAEDAAPSRRPAHRIVALCLAYRRWAVEHPLDFQLIYGNPIPGYVAPAEITIPLARRPFLRIFACFLEAFQAGELTIPAEYQAVPPGVAAHMAEWKRQSGIDMPDPLIALLMSGWARIHGMVQLELFNHLQPLVGDAAALYRYEIDALVQSLGMSIAPEENLT
ncbi:MAG: TetR/AcrR family transcriptional regulator [Pseudomonas sp.]|uniref:TetR/AcrR family transcriptional regulator n=1 Tax=Pseudomonas sp. TaxID=306 RepID=UPI00391D618D